MLTNILRNAGRAGRGTVAVLVLSLLAACGNAGPRSQERLNDREHENMIMKRKKAVVHEVRAGDGDIRTCALAVIPFEEEYRTLYTGKPYYLSPRSGWGTLRRVRREGGTVVRVVGMEVFSYGYTPSVIVVNRGDRVRIFATSRDITHGMAIREYGIDVPLNRGEIKKIEFTADKAGEFSIRCPVYCGEGHAQMAARFIVQDAGR